MFYEVGSLHDKGHARTAISAIRFAQAALHVHETCEPRLVTVLLSGMLELIMQAFCRPAYSTVKWPASRQTRFLHLRTSSNGDTGAEECRPVPTARKPVAYTAS